jgi:hypothetical protein
MSACDATDAAVSSAARGCVACPSGSYKEGFASQTCAACPLHSLSPVATAVDYGCICDSGYTAGWNSTCCFQHTPLNLTVGRAAVATDTVLRCVSVLLPAAPLDPGCFRSFLPGWSGERLDCWDGRNQSVTEAGVG